MPRRAKSVSTPTNTPLSKNFSKIISFRLPPTLTVEMADDLGAELKQLPLTEKVSLTLDATDVETISTPGLQLIVSLEKTVTGLGGQFQIQSPPEHIAQAFMQTGLQNLLAQPT